jgi:hypothetical protein
MVVVVDVLAISRALKCVRECRPSQEVLLLGKLVAKEET